MKIVKEHINEKFDEKSDPIADLHIGQIDLRKVFNDTVGKGVREWYKFLKDLDLIGKKVTFITKSPKKEETIIISEIKRGQLPNEIYFFNENKRMYELDVKEKLIIHK